MNKTLLSAALIASFGFAAFAPSTARASDGTITINGQVNAATCTVAVTGTSGSTVTLPTVATTVLGAAGNTAGQTAFSIGLTGCSSGVTKAATYFEAGPNVNAAGRLNNSGLASNVNVQLVNSDGTTPIVIGSAAPSSGVGSFAVSGGTATLNYFARYYATGAAGPGDVATSVTFSMVYN
ncbi:fimbrial protein [Rhodanobacter ginsengisoli]|uniref:Fimbrial protein n=1 Tax=Rhodanobacter ginsengisoli TaxID=418646 RepID=A0ABW0QSU0_9GAMM